MSLGNLGSLVVCEIWEVCEFGSLEDMRSLGDM